MHRYLSLPEASAEGSRKKGNRQANMPEPLCAHSGTAPAFVRVYVWRTPVWWWRAPSLAERVGEAAGAGVGKPTQPAEAKGTNSVGSSPRKNPSTSKSGPCLSKFEKNWLISETAVHNAEMFGQKCFTFERKLLEREIDWRLQLQPKNEAGSGR